MTIESLAQPAPTPDVTRPPSKTVGPPSPNGDRAGRHRSPPLDSVSVVLPCLNEAAAVAGVVRAARRGLARAGLDGEIVVVDNGSTDGSAEAAAEAGAIVVREARRGYGAAVAAGLRRARGDAVVVADADGSYDLERVGELVVPLASGADLVVGSRIGGEIAPGAMPRLHRHVGTPALTALLRLLTGLRVSDSQSGYRAIRREALEALDLRAQGMEYASEMLLRAKRAGLRIVEVPTPYRLRVGRSKLAPWGDGWRHLKLLLLLSPHFSLLAPGAFAAALGLALCGVSLVAPTGVTFGPLRWLPVFLGPMLLILGTQTLLLGCLAAHRSQLAPPGLRRRLAWLDQPAAAARLAAALAAVAAVGMLADAVLLVLWLTGRSGPALLGVAGLAQALIVIGIGGVATLIAADVARDALLW